MRVVVAATKERARAYAFRKLDHVSNEVLAFLSLDELEPLDGVAPNTHVYLVPGVPPGATRQDVDAIAEGIEHVERLARATVGLLRLPLIQLWHVEPRVADGLPF